MVSPLDLTASASLAIFSFSFVNLVCCEPDILKFVTTFRFVGNNRTTELGSKFSLVIGDVRPFDEIIYGKPKCLHDCQIQWGAVLLTVVRNSIRTLSWLYLIWGKRSFVKHWKIQDYLHHVVVFLMCAPRDFPDTNIVYATRSSTIRRP